MTTTDGTRVEGSAGSRVNRAGGLRCDGVKKRLGLEMCGVAGTV